MAATQIVPGLYAIPVGPVNTFLLESPDGCTLIDSGLPGSAEKILQAIRELGKKPKDIRHIVLTHAHPDHIGGLAALARRLWLRPRADGEGCYAFADDTRHNITEVCWRLEVLPCGTLLV